MQTYPCCSFVGNFAALTFDREILEFYTVWNQTMLPGPNVPGGWAGVGVWGSQPAIDVVRNQVFIGKLEAMSGSMHVLTPRSNW